MIWSAPGKLFLFGEYAVLRGAPAIVTAVDRRVIARPAAAYSVVGIDADPALPEAVRDEVGVEALNWEVDVTQMTVAEGKLGLGSSAASAVVLTAASLNTLEAQKVYPGALRAHLRFQGGAGSGADVAASAYGGTIAVTPTDDIPTVEALDWPEDLVVYPVWTGKPANTRRFMEAVDATDKPLTQMQQLAAAALTAFRAGDVERLLVIASDYDAAMGKLGASAGVPIRTRLHNRIARIVRDFGATAKPSGAGGGDVTLVFGRKDLERSALASALPKDARLLDLEIGAVGLSRSESE